MHACLIFFILLTFTAKAEKLPTELEKISEKREWSVLLHYADGWLSNRSLVDDPAFFLDKNGKYNKQAELEALYRALYIKPNSGADYAGCRFPARAEFLARELGRPVDGLMLGECKDFSDYMSSVKPYSASIIFPFYHMNGPASMFGHTLLRFDSGDGAELASSAVTYAAMQAVGDNGVEYAFKGLFGFYPGKTQIIPYHEKIREYDNINQRDIWEYKLNMTPDQVRRMALHAFEIRTVWSRYFFFDENCSYMLLFIIESGRPDIHLTDQFLWVIPADTMFLLNDKKLLGEMTYRPSQTTKMLHMLSDKTSEMYKLAVEAMNTGTLGDYSKLPEEEKAKLLDFWSAYTMFVNRSIDSRSVYSKRLIDVLRKRAKIKVSYKDEITHPVEPLKGHGASRLKVSAGVKGGGLFQEINWHPALHAVEDDDDGYLAGSSIMFFDITGRIEDGEAYLKKLALVEINSLSPVNEIFDPLSWRVSFGFEHMDRGDLTVGYVLSAAGKTYNVYDGLIYGLAGLKLQGAGGLEDNFSLGFTADAGYMKQFGKYKIKADVVSNNHFLGETFSEYDASVFVRRFFREKHMVSVGYIKDFHDADNDETIIEYGFYF